MLKRSSSLCSVRMTTTRRQFVLLIKYILLYRTHVRLLGLPHRKVYRDNYRGTPCQLPRYSAVVTAERVGQYFFSASHPLEWESCVKKTTAQCNPADCIAYRTDYIVFTSKNPADNPAYYYAYNPAAILHLPLVLRGFICSLRRSTR